MKAGSLSPFFSLNLRKHCLILFLLLLFTPLLGSPKIGLALSGGGARGLAHIGVLKVLEKNDIEIDYIAGTSSGALIAAMYAAGYSADEIEQKINAIDWQMIMAEDVKRQELHIGEKRWAPYSNVSFYLDDKFRPQLPQAIMQGHNLINIIFELLYPAIHIRDFDKLAIPYRCVATNILTGERKVFSEGNLHEVVRASMSFPSVFVPFEIDSELYIDGGIVSNLPSDVLKEMGAERIIAVQTNSGLKSKEELSSVIDIIDQTINLNIVHNIERSQKEVELLITPELADYSIIDFDQKEEIISEGEKAAELVGYELKKYTDRKKSNRNAACMMPEPISFEDIKVEGNIWLSNAKVREYFGLNTNENYNAENIFTATRSAYTSDLFAQIYPTINKVDNKYYCTLKVEERNRKTMSLSLTYNNNNELTAGVYFTLNNLLQTNSKLLINFQAGDKTELNLDYVKNFGRQWGAYFRIFPYLREDRLYTYNEEHEKENSVLSLETGLTAGVGIFSAYDIVLEGYAYGYHYQNYRDIAEFSQSKYTLAGVGLKAYYETLDDYVFPMQGNQIMLKYSTANKDFMSDESRQMFYGEAQFLLPLSYRTALKYKFEYGSFFKRQTEHFEQFLIGGIDSFLGFYPRERSAPIYRINTFALRMEPITDFFVDLQYNILTLGDIDIWLPDDNFYHAAGVQVGYRSILGPIRAAMAVNDNKRIFYYLSIGYEFDPFIFSRP
jgi:NTE family protein